jgi:transcriptional regulator with AAA-type ATPase domain
MGVSKSLVASKTQASNVLVANTLVGFWTAREILKKNEENEWFKPLEIFVRRRIQQSFSSEEEFKIRFEEEGGEEFKEFMKH